MCGDERPRLREGLVDVLEDVVDVLDADRQAHGVLRDAGRLELLGVQLRVRGRRVVDRERARIADVGEVREQAEALDERLARLEAALDAERDEAAVAAGEDSARDLVRRARVEAGVRDPRDAVAALEVAGDVTR